MKAALPLLALLLLAIPVHAVDEADAPALNERVAEVGHSPAIVKPGSQWDGFIRFHEGHNITDVAIKICRVGVFCNINGPLADRIDDNTWNFNTAGKVLGGGSVPWGVNDKPGDDSDWRVGVQYYLFTEDMDYDTADGLDFDELSKSIFLPHGEPCGVELTREEWVACEETHYIAFDIEGRAPQGEQANSPFLLLPLLAALLWVRRA